jgi:PAS domain S-box-containing protein
MGISRGFPPKSALETAISHDKSHETPSPPFKHREDPSFPLNSLLTAIVECSDDAIMSNDLDGSITSWNDAATRIFGYVAEEIIGQPILRLVPEDLHEEEEKLMERLKAGESIEHFETKGLGKNGGLIVLSVAISPIRDIDGRVIGASKTARDISARDRNQEAQARLASIVQSSDDAIISKNLNGIITSWNEAAGRMFGYTSEEIIGQPILRLIPKELHPEEDTILRKLRAGERIDHYETTRVGKNGKFIEVSVTISPLKDRAGRIVGASKIVRDISSRKQMERLLIQSEKLAATGRMAATIAHEINNPMESLINLIYLARKSSSDRSKVEAYLLTAEQEIERVSHIARQTLGFYRGTSAPVEVHLHELVEDVLGVYHSRLSSSGILVDSKFEDHRPVKVNRGELVQVFSNIIANAIDAMPRGGRLEIELRKTVNQEQEGIQAIIRDGGTGIKKEYLQKIFEPFFTTKGDLGTGIGLWVARQLIEKHGGQIALTSSTDMGNSGTTVFIHIPFRQMTMSQKAGMMDV